MNSILSNNVAVEFVTSYISKGLLLTCRIPTRIRESSASLIDNIFTNLETLGCKFIVESTSDHFVILCNFQTRPSPTPSSFWTRILYATSIDKLKSLLSQVDWSVCWKYGDMDKATEYFNGQFKKSLMRPVLYQAGKLGVIFSQRNNGLQLLSVFYPYKTKSLQEIHGKSSTWKSGQFRQYRHFLTKPLPQAKQSYYLHEFQNVKGHQKRYGWLLIDALKKLN